MAKNAKPTGPTLTSRKEFVQRTGTDPFAKPALNPLSILGRTTPVGLSELLSTTEDPAGRAFGSGLALPFNLVAAGIQNVGLAGKQALTDVAGAAGPGLQKLSEAITPALKDVGRGIIGSSGASPTSPTPASTIPQGPRGDVIEAEGTDLPSGDGGGFQGWTIQEAIKHPEAYLTDMESLIASSGLGGDSEFLAQAKALVGRDLLQRGGPALAEVVRPWLQDKPFPTFVEKRKIQTGTELAEATFGRRLLIAAIEEGERVSGKFVTPEGKPTPRAIRKFDFMVVTPQGTFGLKKDFSLNPFDAGVGFTGSTIPSSVAEEASDLESAITARIGN